MPAQQGLGMTRAQLEPMRDGLGVRSRQAFEGSPAHQAGMQAGDEIIAVDEMNVQNALFHELRLSAAPGVSSTFRVQRADGTHDLTITRVARPG
ncbi:PDZ domain-containing protein [Deinococcus radiotolerans]|nr:PDZ domain-containing protein [Deinococcus radiotolerans]